MLILWLLLILAVAAAFPPVVRSWKEKRSRNWPRAEASLENFEISRGGRGYKSELAELAESLQNGLLFTRYNRVSPNKFFLDSFQDVTEKA